MLDVYDYYDKPEGLFMSDERWRVSVTHAVAFLERHPDNVSAIRYMVNKPSRILQYVSKTKKPFIEGEKALANDISNLIQYYSIIKERGPKLEKQLLHDKDEANIMLYNHLVMGGTWSEANKLFPSHDPDWMSDTVSEFNRSLKSANVFRVGEELSTPLNYIAKANGTRLEIRDVDNNNVIGYIEKQGDNFVFYKGDKLVDSYKGDTVPGDVLAEFIHLLSGAW